MTKSQAVKINTSSLQVLKALLVMFNNNYTMAELVEHLNKDEKVHFYNNSVVSKYINTFRYCGIEITKIHNKYFLCKMPFGLDLSTKDIDLLDYLLQIAKRILGEKSYKVFEHFFGKISKFSNKNIMRVEGKTEKQVFEDFYNAINDCRKVEIIHKTKVYSKCTPLEIVQGNKRPYFKVLYENKEKLISIDRILGIKILNERFCTNYSNQTILFKLRGGLSKRYTLREHEKLVNSNSNEIIVSNKGEPIVNDEKALAGQAYRNVAKRIMGEEVPFLNLDEPKGFMEKVKDLFAKLKAKV